MHTQKHLHKKHPKQTIRTAKNRKQAPLKARQFRRLCAKGALCTSVFTLTLLVSSEWSIQKPQSDNWKQHVSKTAALLSAGTSDSAASSLSQSKNNRKPGQDTDKGGSLKKQASHNTAASDSAGRNKADSQKTGADTAASGENNAESVNRPAGTDSAAAQPDGSAYTDGSHTGQPDDSSDNPPVYAEYDKTKPQQTPGTDERTLYSVNPDTGIYYSYEDNQVQFSANAGQSIQAVPERQAEEQRIDTTADDTETEHYQQISSQWNLILVNPWNQIPDDYEISLTDLPNGHSIDSRCYPALTEMMSVCREAGLRPLICSSYRSGEKQKALFQERIDELAAQGYSKKDALQKAATSVARPGTSEHQAGLAVDIVDSSHQLLDASQEHTPVQQWLMENSWKYGFILRYPLDKSRLTGIIYEPWHYRYVGVEAAAEIYERGICLEEYLEELS